MIILIPKVDAWTNNKLRRDEFNVNLIAIDSITDVLLHVVYTTLAWGHEVIVPNVYFLLNL